MKLLGSEKNRGTTLVTGLLQHKKMWFIHYVRKLRLPLTRDSNPQLLNSLYLLKELNRQYFDHPFIKWLNFMLSSRHILLSSETKFFQNASEERMKREEAVTQKSKNLSGEHLTFPPLCTFQG